MPSMKKQDSGSHPTESNESAMKPELGAMVDQLIGESDSSERVAKNNGQTTMVTIGSMDNSGYK